MLQDLREDLARYRRAGIGWPSLIVRPVIWVLVWYRFGRWLYTENSSKLVRALLRIPYLFGELFLEVVMQMKLDPAAKIGGGLYLTHVGGILIHFDAVIGKNCNLAHGVTIGAVGLGRKGAPRIGDNVFIGTGATLIGAITVGDGARIAANTLVNRDVPSGATVMGVPGKVMTSRKRLQDAAHAGDVGGESVNAS